MQNCLTITTEWFSTYNLKIQDCLQKRAGLWCPWNGWDRTNAKIAEKTGNTLEICKENHYRK